MKLSFASDLNHAIESAMKMYQRTGLMKRWNRQGYLAGLVVMALAALVFPGDWTRKVLFGALLGAIFAVLYPEQCKKSIRKRIRKMIIEQRGTDEEVPFDIVVNNKGVEACWSNSRVTFAWSKVSEIVEHDKTVDIYMRDNSVIVAPAQAFSDDDQRRRFLDEADSCRNRAKRKPTPSESS